MGQPDFFNAAQFGFHNGQAIYGESVMHRQGDTSRVLPSEVLMEQQPELGQALMVDCNYLNISPDIIRAVRIITHEGVILPTHLGIEVGIGDNLMRAAMAMEVGYVDGAQRVWDGRLIITPGQLLIPQGEMPILPIMKDIGYHVLIKKPTVAGVSPMVRNDSLCVPSMIDGHYASAGDRTIGCDCEPQRHLSQEIIQKNPGGGVSLLAPYSGRGNGIHPHSGQLMVQNFSTRHNLDFPATYTAYEEQGYPADSRPDYYWLDAAILKMCGLDRFTLLTNNPDKANVFQAYGLSAIPKSFYALERKDYYEKGVNFAQKVSDGGHKDFHE